VIDIFLTKYIKLKVLINDPGFDGTLRDYLNHAEKMRILNEPEKWMALRELRNIQAHDYTEDDLERFLTSLELESEFVIHAIGNVEIEN